MAGESSTSQALTVPRCALMLLQPDKDAVRFARAYYAALFAYNSFTTALSEACAVSLLLPAYFFASKDTIPLQVNAATVEAAFLLADPIIQYKQHDKSAATKCLKLFSVLGIPASVLDSPSLVDDCHSYLENSNRTLMYWHEIGICMRVIEAKAAMREFDDALLSVMRELQQSLAHVKLPEGVYRYISEVLKFQDLGPEWLKRWNQLDMEAVRNVLRALERYVRSIK